MSRRVLDEIRLIPSAVFSSEAVLIDVGLKEGADLLVDLFDNVREYFAVYVDFVDVEDITMLWRAVIDQAVIIVILAGHTDTATAALRSGIDPDLDGQAIDHSHEGIVSLALRFSPRGPTLSVLRLPRLRPALLLVSIDDDGIDPRTTLHRLVHALAVAFFLGAPGDRS